MGDYYQHLCFCCYFETLSHRSLPSYHSSLFNMQVFEWLNLIIILMTIITHLNIYIFPHKSTLHIQSDLDFIITFIFIIFLIWLIYNVLVSGMQQSKLCVCVCIYICVYIYIYIYNMVKKVKMLVAQSCPTLCDPIDCGLPGSSVHGILQAKIVEWVAMPYSRGSSQPRD